MRFILESDAKSGPTVKLMHDAQGRVQIRVGIYVVAELIIGEGIRLVHNCDEGHVCMPVDSRGRVKVIK